MKDTIFYNILWDDGMDGWLAINRAGAGRDDGVALDVGGVVRYSDVRVHVS